MYHAHFGLTEPAFSIAVNPRYLFMSAQHQEALAHLVFGVQTGGFVMLTGEVGTGKTTMIRRLLEQLPEHTDLAFILNPMANAPELLCTICDELGVEYPPEERSIKALTDHLQQFLLDNHGRGRKTILLIDEAQLLRVPVLEQIRLLTNLETSTQKLLQIILVGQPELKALLARPALRQLSQRITARFHLEALNEADTGAYIAHRLSVAGLGDAENPFSEALVKRIHAVSGGIPRLINVICERSLLGAYAANRSQVDAAIVQDAVREILGAPRASMRLPAQFVPGVAAAITLVVTLGVWWWLDKAQPAVTTPMASETALTGSDMRLLALARELAGGYRPAAVETSNNLPIGAATAPQNPLLNNLSTTPEPVLGQLVRWQTGSTKIENYRCAGHWAAVIDDWVCEKLTLGSWNELQILNRPVILTLLADDKRWRYVLVEGIGREQLRVQPLGEGAETLRSINLDWREVAARWNGEALFIWRKPGLIAGTLQTGDRGAAVVWLAERFADLDGQSTPLTRDVYTEKLRKRVELFQLSHDLFADGMFGVQTLRKLNEVLGLEKTLVNLDELRVTEGQ